VETPSSRQKTSKAFEVTDDEFPLQVYMLQGIRVLAVDQKDYQQQLSIMPEDGNYRDFSSIRMQLAWLSHNRPDVLYEVSQLTQVNCERFEEN